MRLDRGLSDLLATRSHLAVLRALSHLPEGLERSGRDLARRAGISQPAAARALHDLAEHAVVTVRRVPPAEYFGLNRDQILVQVLIQAFITEDHVPTALLWHLKSNLEPAGARDIRLYGTAARGQMGPSSDVDVAVIAPRGGRATVLEAAGDLYDSIWRRFGVRPSFLVGEVSVAAMVGGERSASGVWHRIAEEGIGLPS